MAIKSKSVPYQRERREGYLYVRESSGKEDTDLSQETCGAEPAELGRHEKNSWVGCLWLSEESECGGESQEIKLCEDEFGNLVVNRKQRTVFSRELI